jgi:hypothetical protein
MRLLHDYQGLVDIIGKSTQILMQAAKDNQLINNNRFSDKFETICPSSFTYKVLHSPWPHRRIIQHSKMTIESLDEKKNRAGNRNAMVLSLQSLRLLFRFLLRWVKQW